MNHPRTYLPPRIAYLLALTVAGCSPPSAAPSPEPPVSAPSPVPPLTRTVQRPAPPTSTPSRSADDIPPDRQDNPHDTWDTPEDRRFAEFLREKSGGMIRQSAVGLSEAGKLRVQLSESVDPDDTLPLTRSILAGAKRDFSGKPFTLFINDPNGGLILKARVDEGGSVHYGLPGGGDLAAAEAPGRSDGSTGAADALARGGVTERDRRFASWAEEHGRAYLRYVQADLERHGRLWFGVTRDVKPEDVKDLTRSLLEGASKEFPGQALTATVFDPEGERIGRARRSRGGEVEWEQ
jgi:hypothetical protein